MNGPRLPSAFLTRNRSCLRAEARKRNRKVRRLLLGGRESRRDVGSRPKGCAEGSAHLLRLGTRVLIVALLDGVALVRRRVEELARELLLHRAPVGAVTRRADDPAHAEGERAIRTDVDGNLIGRATDAAALDLDLRLN